MVAVVWLLAMSCPTATLARVAIVAWFLVLATVAVLGGVLVLA